MFCLKYVVLAVFSVVLLAGCSTATNEVSETPTSSAGLPNPTQTSGSPSPESSVSSTPTPESTVSGFDYDAESTTDPASYWVVVNKANPLDPADYAATDLVTVPVDHVYTPVLRQAASDAVVEMFAAFADETGLKMQSQSAYRSYSSQKGVYAGWVSSLGKEGADLTSARAGYSEHQTGLALDISAKPSVCALDQCFADTPQGEWLAANAWEYGFILRYPDGYTDVTGYEFEPWHYRYVGLDLAKEYHDTGATTLEEFFGMDAAPDYLD